MRSSNVVHETLNRAMRTGELARRAACSSQHVRNLEREGVLPPSTRDSNGYRTFTEQHLQVLLAYQRLSTAIGPVQAKQVIASLVTDPAAVAPRMDELHAQLHAERTALHQAVMAARTISGENVEPGSAQDAMSISELAAALAVRPSTLRHWEAEGLLAPGRDPVTQARSYSPADVRDARIIDQLRRAGYRIPDLRAVLADLRRTGTGEDLLGRLDRRAAALDVRSRALLAAAAHLLAFS